MSTLGFTSPYLIMDSVRPICLNVQGKRGSWKAMACEPVRVSTIARAETAVARMCARFDTTKLVATRATPTYHKAGIAFKNPHSAGGVMGLERAAVTRQIVVPTKARATEIQVQWVCHIH